MAYTKKKMTGKKGSMMSNKPKKKMMKKGMKKGMKSSY